MILELDSTWTDNARQLRLLCIPHFPVNDSCTYRERLTEYPLELNTLHLSVILWNPREGRRMTGPFCWARAQSQYGIRPRACMGLGSPHCIIGTGPGACMSLRSWCRTVSNKFFYSSSFIDFVSFPFFFISLLFIEIGLWLH